MSTVVLIVSLLRQNYATRGIPECQIGVPAFSINRLWFLSNRIFYLLFLIPSAAQSKYIHCSSIVSALDPELLQTSLIHLTTAHARKRRWTVTQVLQRISTLDPGTASARSGRRLSSKARNAPTTHVPHAPMFANRT
ncbi:hypothetical protein BDW67DRAFT_18361 [Aspergillus spinulosporus]